MSSLAPSCFALVRFAGLKDREAGCPPKPWRGRATTTIPPRDFRRAWQAENSTLIQTFFPYSNCEAGFRGGDAVLRWNWRAGRPLAKAEQAA
jgi:hypothetical protein